jgi:argininosuccinate lyase
LGFAYPVLRDLARIENLWTRLNLSPMGCGSTNGSRLRQGREGMAELLGFDGLISHARDAMWQADLFIEISALLSASSISLSRLAEDLQVFSSQEFALVELDDCHARASKIMPQKKNPFALTHIRSVANKLIGLTASVAASVRTPTGQPDNRTLIYGELPEAIESVGHSAALLAEVLKSMTFNQARGEALVASGWVMATDLAEMLVIEYGVDFRSAHQLLAKLASDYPRKSLLDLDRQALIALAEKQLGGKIRLTEQQWASSLDVNAALQARSESGGAAAVSMMKMLADCRQQLGAFSDKVQARKNLFSSREQALLQQVSQLIRPAEAANHD